MNSIYFQKCKIIAVAAFILFFTYVKAQNNFGQAISNINAVKYKNSEVSPYKNSFAVPEKQWIKYLNKTNLLFEKVDKESFLNYVIFSNDGSMADKPYFKKFISEAWQRDKEEIIYKIGTGVISDEQHLKLYLASLQPKYSIYWNDFKTKRDVIIESENTNNQNRSPINNDPTPFNCGSPCSNPGFENGTTSFWDGWTGTACTSPDPCSLTTGFNSSQHVITTLGAYDATVGGTILPQVPPGGGNNALMLGNGPINGSQAARISMSFTVSAANANFTYRYAVVLEDPVSGHTNDERPYFRAKIRDASGNLVTCGFYEIIADASQSGFSLFFTQTSSSSNIWYRNWTSVFVPLSSYIGQCITMEFTSSDCSQGGHFGYAYVDADCAPLALLTSSPAICGGNAVTLTAPAGAASYAWTNTSGGTTGIVGATNGPTAVVAQAGTYQVELTSVAGATCTTILTITIGTGPASPVPLFTNTTVCAGSPTQFTDASTPSGSVNGWAWDFDNDGVTDDTTQNPSHIFTAQGTYPVVLTVSMGPCNAAITQNVTVNSGSVPVITPAGPFCTSDAAVNLTASVSGGTWSGTGVNASGNFNPAFATVGNNVITYTMSGPCSGSATATIIINPPPIPAAGADITICTGDIGNLGAASTAGYTYSWASTSGLSSSTISNPTVTLTNITSSPVTTTYTVTATSGGCFASDQVNVTVNPVPTANAGTIQSVCEGTNITLSGSVGGSATSGAWSGGGGTYSPGNTVLNAVYTPSAAEYAAGSVTLTLTASGLCPVSSSNVTFYFYKNPVINYTVDDPDGCPVHCVTFTDNSSVTGGGNIVSWSWNFGDNGSSSSQNPFHCYTQTGYYDVSLSVTSNHGCSAFKTIPQMIHVFAIPVAQFNPEPSPATILEPNVTLYNQSSSDVNFWSWDFGDGTTLTDNSSSPTHNYPHEGPGSFTTILIVHNADGCWDTVPHEIVIIPEFTFFIPNAFSPNGDGVNDYFFGSGVGIVDYDFWILDRWGSVIFHSDSLDKKWDGKANNGANMAQQDVYVWKVKLTDVFGKKHNYIGTVTLIK